MRWRLIVLVISLFVAGVPLYAQDDLCSRDTIITAFAEATDIDAWVQQYNDCPVYIQRAVRQLATGYQLLGSEYLPFGAAGDPLAFSSIWTWYQGSSGGLIYNIDPVANAVTLIAASETVQRDDTTSAPVLAYPTSGDFTARVKVNFDPLYDENGAAIGVRDAQNVAQWIRISRDGGNVVVSATENGETTTLESVPYEEGENVIYFRIERTGTQFGFSFSVDGEDWREVVKQHPFNLPDDVELYLTTYSPQTSVLTAQFMEMKVE